MREFILANIVRVGDKCTKVIYVLIPGRSVNIQSEFIIEIMNKKRIIAFQISYIAFLMMFTCTVLVKIKNKPSWEELYTIIYVCTLDYEKVRQFVSSEPVAIRYDTLRFLPSCSQF
jgi:hypothetical protein